MKTRAPQTITPEQLDRLNTIFMKKGWSKRPHKANPEFCVFDKFCYMLQLLSPDEAELILTLTEDFHVFEFLQYEELFFELFSRIPFDQYDAHANVIILPIKNYNRASKEDTKSGDFLAYFIKAQLLPHLHFFQSRKCKVISGNDLSQIGDECGQRRLIILVDDFIGTGESTLKALKFLKSYLSKDDTVVVATLAILNIGLERIVSEGLSVYYSVSFSKGIGDSKVVDKARAYELMESIEDRMRFSEIYKCGFQGSEALVKMMRTPNNTFPVYWCKQGKDEDVWPAPFPRY